MHEYCKIWIFCYRFAAFDCAMLYIAFYESFNCVCLFVVWIAFCCGVDGVKVSIGVRAGYWHGAKAKSKIKRDFQTLADLHPHWEVAADPDCVESHHQGGDKLDHLVIVLVTAVILILGVLNLKMGRLVHWKDIIVTWFYWFCDKYSPVILSDTSSTTGTAWVLLV